MSYINKDTPKTELGKWVPLEPQTTHIRINDFNKDTFSIHYKIENDVSPNLKQTIPLIEQALACIKANGNASAEHYLTRALGSLK